MKYSIKIRLKELLGEWGGVYKSYIERNMEGK